MPAAAAAVFASPEPASFCISRYGSFINAPHEPVFSALILMSFFLMCFAGGRAACFLPDRFRGQEDRETDGTAGIGGAFVFRVSSGLAARRCAFYPGPLWSDMSPEY